MGKKNKNKWIKVSDNLPEPYEIVLCLFLFGSEIENKKAEFKIVNTENYMIVADRIEKISNGFARGRRSGYIVSYWMPLPKLPKSLKKIYLRSEYKE